ncbi:MAG: DNA polymerase III subunit alpha, partial [Treponema sp.]|nr:DNA polymerase III subunit alpha [Treponema sp.]
GVLGPDLNLSRRNYYSFKNAVVIGFMSVAGLSLSAIEAIEGERLRNGPFRSLDEIVSRLDLARDDLIALVAAGAFDSLAGGLARSLQARLLLVSRGGGDRADGGQKSLFADSRPGPIPGASRTEAELWQEFSALGYLRDRHPLSLWERDIAPIERIMARDLGAHLGRRVRLIGWPVTQKEVLTLGGLAMNFLSLEDETALYDTVLFPEAYGRYRKLLLDQQPLIVEGIVKDEDGALGVELSRVLTLAGPTGAAGAAGPPLSQPT